MRDERERVDGAGENERKKRGGERKGKEKSAKQEKQKKCTVVVGTSIYNSIPSSLP